MYYSMTREEKTRQTGIDDLLQEYCDKYQINLDYKPSKIIRSPFTEEDEIINRKLAEYGRIKKQMRKLEKEKSKLSDLN